MHNNNYQQQPQQQQQHPAMTTEGGTGNIPLKVGFTATTATMPPVATGGSGTFASLTTANGGVHRPAQQQSPYQNSRSGSLIMHAHQQHQNTPSPHLHNQQHHANSSTSPTCTPSGGQQQRQRRQQFHGSDEPKVPAAVNKGIICQQFFHRRKCEMAPGTCPYAHIADGDTFSVPADVCKDWEETVCMTERCPKFHATAIQLKWLREKNATHYKPQDYMLVRQPMVPISWRYDTPQESENGGTNTPSQNRSTGTPSNSSVSKRSSVPSAPSLTPATAAALAQLQAQQQSNEVTSSVYMLPQPACTTPPTPPPVTMVSGSANDTVSMQNVQTVPALVHTHQACSSSTSVPPTQYAYTAGGATVCTSMGGAMTGVASGPGQPAVQVCHGVSFQQPTGGRQLSQSSGGGGGNSLTGIPSSSISFQHYPVSGEFNASSGLAHSTSLEKSIHEFSFQQ